MNRLNRISTILIHLQSRSIVKAEQIADRFGISLRTVYRDIKTIQAAGVPIISEPGIGYSIMDGYRLPPVQFTVEEATAFLTAEKLIEKLTDHGMDDYYKSAMYKIRSVLRSKEKEYLETIEQVIKVKENKYLPTDQYRSNALDTILKSIYQQKQLSIEYFAGYSQQNTIRNIEAIGIVFGYGHWLVIAYCHLRRDYRTFRVDRITKVQLSDKPIGTIHPPIDQFITKIKTEKKLHEVILATDVHNLRYFGDQKYYNGFVSQEIKDGVVTMTFLTSSLYGFARWYMMFGDIATILAPPELVVKCKELVHAIEKNLG
jgi:predicted DNA-binding transcriptional regulator YafY